ncbi:MAG: hypothetical protein IJF19_02015 [Clostridia bacterium]|nr:hypothetical protein [Clostridia bacterium]
MKYQTKQKILAIIGKVLGVLIILNFLFSPVPEVTSIILLVLLIAYLILVIIWQRCPYCNKSIRFGKSNYCPHCGKDLIEE